MALNCHRLGKCYCSNLSNESIEPIEHCTQFAHNSRMKKLALVLFTILSSNSAMAIPCSELAKNIALAINSGGSTPPLEFVESRIEREVYLDAFDTTVDLRYITYSSGLTDYRMTFIANDDPASTGPKTCKLLKMTVLHKE
jgi:hypothetical protein